MLRCRQLFKLAGVFPRREGNIGPLIGLPIRLRCSASATANAGVTGTGAVEARVFVGFSFPSTMERLTKSRRRDSQPTAALAIHCGVIQ